MQSPGPHLSHLLVKVTDILGREGPYNQKARFQPLPLWSRADGRDPQGLPESRAETGRPGQFLGPGQGQAGLPPQLSPTGVPAPPSLSCRRRLLFCTEPKMDLL